MHIPVPGDERVIGSGSGVAAPKSLPGNRTEYTFKWAKPGFPGTIIAGKFLDPVTAGVATCVSTSPKSAKTRPRLRQPGRARIPLMSGTFGQPESGRLNLVELPDDTVSAAWAPEIAAIAGSRIAARNASAYSPTPSPTSGGATRSPPLP